MKLITRVYYIGRRNNSASNPPALFRKELTTSAAMNSDELVEGIETMRFAFGEDTNATSDKVANIYRNASSVANWARVVSIRVGLLAATAGNVDANTDTRVYSLADNSAGPYNDKKRRRAFNSTIQLRNR